MESIAWLKLSRNKKAISHFWVTQQKTNRGFAQNKKGFKFIQLKEYKVSPCLQGLGFHLFRAQTRLFQSCQLKKEPSVSRGYILLDEWGGWRISFSYPFYRPPPHETAFWVIPVEISVLLGLFLNHCWGTSWRQ